MRRGDGEANWKKVSIHLQWCLDAAIHGSRQSCFLTKALGIFLSSEQPFHSLDVNYSFYPSDSWTVKLKVQNILDETVEIRRAGIVTFSEAPGMAVSLKVKYDF